MKQHPDGILFDLFGTLVSIDASRLPRDADDRIFTIHEIDELLDQLSPRVNPEKFFEALKAISTEIVDEKRARGHVELSSHERFARAIARLDLAGNVDHVAHHMSERHMASLGAAVVCPPDRQGLLEGLAERYRVGLVSNFDHAATAHGVLGRNGLAERLDPIVISDDVDVRKPGARIFEIACSRLGLEPQRVLYVGDSFDADVVGATAAGLAVVWIDDSDADHAPALARLGDVSELPRWLDRFFAGA